MKYAKKRDGNEKAIVEALEALGATVTRLGDAGVPDLLVAYRGETLLIEVKDPAQAKKAYRAGAGGGRVALTDAQRKWWDAPWPGGRRAVVESVEEALAFVRNDGGVFRNDTLEALLARIVDRDENDDDRALGDIKVRGSASWLRERLRVEIELHTRPAAPGFYRLR